MIAIKTNPMKVTNLHDESKKTYTVEDAFNNESAWSHLILYSISLLFPAAGYGIST